MIVVALIMLVAQIMPVGNNLLKVLLYFFFWANYINALLTHFTQNFFFVEKSKGKLL